MSALIPTTWMPMKIKRTTTTTNQLVQDNNTIDDAEIVCEWKGQDIKIVCRPTTPITTLLTTSGHFISSLKVGDDILVKGKFMITADPKRKDRATVTLPLTLKEAKIRNMTAMEECNTRQGGPSYEQVSVGGEKELSAATASSTAALKDLAAATIEIPKVHASASVQALNPK
ncbi:hypothetical protein BGZ65_001114 [Modicella reniformis]|uniref:Uncharacterized protein n=1 Tax=Modicella reniformis TaxID=1440133 RepID=A0A9P6M0X0_9FUNG|nr:hypothetical protein BGZ65_001114 [Modicella reniformis]